MVKLAGKFANVVSKRPVASAVAGGLGAAGLATLGNALSGEAGTEEGGRLGLEAIGAGALGAVMGAQIPTLRGKATKLYRDIGNVSLQNPGAVARRAEMSPQDIKQAEFMRDLLNETVRTGAAQPQQLRDDIKTSLRRAQGAVNLGTIPAGLMTAGAVGGALGGGLANLAGSLGIPGMGIDPEGYSSNNTPGAQYGVKSVASTQYV
jgi:hypothetical protein